MSISIFPEVQPQPTIQNSISFSIPDRILGSLEPEDCGAFSCILNLFSLVGLTVRKIGVRIIEFEIGL